jgi:serine/threonine-protein kinase
MRSGEIWCSEATVYLAYDHKHGRNVAIKVLRQELANAVGAARFLAEIRIAANLQHPHILGLIDSGDADGLLYYVMPFVEGESLRARLTRETQLSIDDAVRIASEVGSALDYAHRHNVVHRDIKPENILLHDGGALVADFGIALALRHAEGDRLTETGTSVGTPRYMSPEQAYAGTNVDARSDIYSLGVVLYEMLAGEPPFTGPTAPSIGQLSGAPTWLCAARSAVPAIDAAVARLRERRRRAHPPGLCAGAALAQSSACHAQSGDGCAPAALLLALHRRSALAAGMTSRQCRRQSAHVYWQRHASALPDGSHRIMLRGNARPPAFAFPPP